MYQHNKTEIIKNNLRKEEMLMRSGICPGMNYTGRQHRVRDSHRALCFGNEGFPSASLSRWSSVPLLLLSFLLLVEALMQAPAAASTDS